MSLKKFITNKTTAALAVLLIVFANTSAFAQSAAAAAMPAGPKPVDMGEVYKSVIFYGLIFLAVCLFISIIGRALKVYELSQEAQGKTLGINWDKINAMLFAFALIIGLYALYWEYTVHGAMILPAASSEHGKRIDTMFNITLILTTIVMVITHILLFGFAYIYKYSPKRKAYYYPHNNTIEKIWTIVPALVLTILVLMGFLTWRSIFYKTVDPNNKPIQIEVTSEQFKWSIRYPGADGIVGKKNYKLTTTSNLLGIDFTDINSRDDQMADEMVIPVGKPIKLILNSKDVIHSFYMPQFRVQLNTVPGMQTIFEFTPTETTKQMQEKLNDPTFKFLFYCAKICGGGHYNMQKDVRVVSESEYKDWLAKQKPYLNDDLRKEFNMPVLAPAPSVKGDSTKADSAAVKNKTLALNK
ncbi:cytochrome c oxidase subunit II [Pedobacter changchengzhani]|uniref:Cytochrome c oxidase subunit 2 n=1 Tax=Pedobacter changchengzhani TaxID=2529274 RepID=A0A4R5MQ88_9SPHI|nr:cytochrome c oxidase subunit II [Pedobacter changchengzhani]TDG38012.1 cytochrome c oxidase subunit II [Pedobacter changchengzhani]